MVEQSDEKENGWSRFIENLILQIETVSSHFRYTEEYVLEHTPEWLLRKFKQIHREKYETHCEGVIESFKGLILFTDSILNKGQNWEKILPPTIERAIEMNQQKERENSQFVAGTWWEQKG